MLLWPKLGYMTRTPFVVMGGFSEGGGEEGSTVQAATARHSGSVDMLTVWAGTGVAHKNRCFRCGNPKHHDPVSPGPVIGPTGRAPQRVPAANPTYRRDGRQNKITGQHMPSVVPPRQPPVENVGSSNAIPWAPGVRVDLVQLEPPKREEPTIYRSIKIWLTNLRSMVRF